MMANGNQVGPITRHDQRESRGTRHSQMFKRLRILILLLILLFVALNTYFDRVYSTDWDIPLRVSVFPINGDGSAVTERYIKELAGTDFVSIESFLEAQGQRYGVTLERPVRFSLGAQIRELPPIMEPGAGTLTAIAWSLRTRYWAWRVPEHGNGPKPDVQLFVLYHDPQKSNSLPHSVGLQKGLFGIVNAFADRELEGSNDTVMAHELLHTLGASDKYNLRDNQPLEPLGIAEPQRDPLYPQVFAELMGGRIPISPSEAEMPTSLRQVLIGPATALEIGWTKK
jgi:hypothetical protein